MKMRLAFLALPLFALATPAHAQSGLSVVGGVVSSTFSAEDDTGAEATGIASRTGFAAGLGLSGAMGDGLAFAPELLYAQKGGNEDGGDGYLKMTFLEVPLLFRYALGGSSSAKVFLTAGPTVAYLLSCNLGGSGESQSCDDAYGPDDSYKKLDYGVLFGAGVSFSRITISARYDLGLANMDKADGYSHKNKALMLLGAYAL